MDKSILKKYKEMNDDEKKKLIQVLKEKNSGNGDKIEWMYKDSNRDNEEYLLGRKVDKNFTDAALPEKTVSTPGALYDEAIARRSQLDMQMKIKEDPLYHIKQKEIEAKRRILENPLKMQKLKAILDKEASSKRRHEQSKQRKRSRRDSSSDEEAEKLLKTYLEIKKLKANENQNIKELKDDEESENQHKSKCNINEVKHTGKDKRLLSNDYSSVALSGNQSKYGLEIKPHDNICQHKKVDYSDISLKKKFLELPKRRKLTDREKEEIRKEMMSNARERDSERQIKIRKH